MKSAKERKLRSRRPLDVLGGGSISASFLRSLHVKAAKISKKKVKITIKTRFLIYKNRTCRTGNSDEDCKEHDRRNGAVAGVGSG